VLKLGDPRSVGSEGSIGGEGKVVEELFAQPGVLERTPGGLRDNVHMIACVRGRAPAVVRPSVAAWEPTCPARAKRKQVFVSRVVFIDSVADGALVSWVLSVVGAIQHPAKRAEAGA
jgi:hypothetical protein